VAAAVRSGRFSAPSPDGGQLCGRAGVVLLGAAFCAVEGGTVWTLAVMLFVAVSTVDNQRRPAGTRTGSLLLG
jgi:hypothetical protein